MENNTIRTRIFGQHLAAEAVVDAIPSRYFENPNTTFFDPAFGGGQYLAAVVKRCEKYHKREQILPRVYGVESNMMFIVRAKRHNNLRGANLSLSFDWPTMKFDVVIGNPPYQLPGQSMSGHKLYNEFSKTAVSLLSKTGFLSFITPISVTKKSKRFSLLNLPGLKSVNFTTSKYFSVGVKVCHWTVENGYTGQVSIFTESGCKLQDQKSLIYNGEEVGDEFALLYHRLKSVVNKPEKRMFKQNAVDTRTCRSFTKTEECQYEMFKVKDGEAVSHQFNLPQPKLYGKKKYVVCTSKVFSKKSCLVSKKDFEVNHMFAEVQSDKQVANLESFIFSPYFVEHTSKFKAMDGYGFNNAIKFLPPFDLNRSWTNEEVKAFVESI